MRGRGLITKVQHRVKAISGRAPLPFALGIATVLAFILTCVSVSIYYIGGTSKLDLSRPGFERERTEVRANDTTKVYDTTSPVTRKVIDEFLKEYDDRVKDLHQYGDFRDQALDDTSLQLTEQDSGQ